MRRYPRDRERYATHKHRQRAHSDRIDGGMGGNAPSGSGEQPAHEHEQVPRPPWSGQRGRGWHRIGPPWGFPPAHGMHGVAPWGMHGSEWRRRQRALFLRFALAFGGMIVLVTAGIALLATSLALLLGESRQVALFTWIGACVLSVMLVMLGVRTTLRAARNITGPLADVMAAADAIASGDLSARVPENTRGVFRRLALTFNRMASELERIDEQRRSLTADVAHELRTPLHIIQGNLEGILDGVYEPTPEHIEMLLEETRLLSRLVEDLRTLAQAEGGHLTLHKERVNVAEMLADVATSFEKQAEGAGVALHVDSGNLGEAAVDADVMRLNQVLANLVANALRYTPAGGSITLSGQRNSEEGEEVRLVVSDTGAGITPEHLPYIFDRFWRGDPTRSHKDGAGGGLGLAIAKQLVELHGGQISAQSTPGEGAVFTIDLPASQDL